MRKSVYAVLLCLAASVLYGQENKVEVYGKFRLDYDLTQAMTEDDPVTTGGFNIDRARFGMVWAISEAVTAKMELDVRDNSKYELRIAEAQWKINSALTFQAGRVYEAFAPESYWHASRFDGIGVTYRTGHLDMIFQTGNSRNANPTSLGIIPAFVYSPDLGENSLKVGANARLRTPYGGDEDWHTFANMYAIYSASGFKALLSTDFNELQDSEGMDIKLYSDLSYSTGSLVPGISVYLEDLSANQGDMVASLDVYTVIKAADGLSVKPCIGLKNLTEANGNDMSWFFTLRFEWNPKYQF